MLNNMNCYPRIHYAYPSYAPFLSAQGQDDHDVSVEDILKSVIKPESSLSYFNPEKSRDPVLGEMNIATCFQFRGDVEPSEVVKSLDSISSELKFSKYVPRAINSSV